MPFGQMARRRRIGIGHATQRGAAMGSDVSRMHRADETGAGKTDINSVTVLPIIP